MGARPFAPRTPALVSREALGARRGHEALALVLFAGAAFLALALASHRADPGDGTLHGADWVGPVGAALAGTLAQGFGLVAWLAPVELLLMGVPLLGGRAIPQLGLRIAGDLVVGVVLAALVEVAAPELRVFGRLSVGGNVGLLFGGLLCGGFSAAGSFLVGGTIVGLILIGRSSFSFIRTCRGALGLATRAQGGVTRGAARLGAAWVEAAELRREREDLARAAAAPAIGQAGDEAIIAALSDDSDESDGIESSPRVALAASLAEPRPADDSDDLLRVVLAGAPSPPPAVAIAEAPEGHAPAPGGASEPAPSVQPPSIAAEPAPAPRRKRADAAPLIVDTQPELEIQKARAPARAPRGAYQLPSADLLHAAPPKIGEEVDRDTLLANAQLLTKVLSDYGIAAKVEEILPGPTVTTYEASLAAGTKVGRVAGLADDLALGLSKRVRIIAPIPGKSRVGFELENEARVPVNLRELVEDERFAKLGEKVPLPVVLGRDIVGKPFYADLASMPHVIVAGATGQGKSVGLNVMLASLLFSRSPEDLRFLMIDPKVVELAPFDGIPHLLLPVVTDMKKAATALRWAVDEMERRYQLFAEAGTRNVTSYNAWALRVRAGEIDRRTPGTVEALDSEGTVVRVPAAKDGDDAASLPGKLPYIVVIIDEFADLMMQQGKDVEASVARLAQKARAAGIHVVLATQRPSVDVITGMIKANFPSRIAYRVAQKVDSRTVLDEQGAEWLLGKGDMLVKINGSDLRRVQCPFVSEEEISALTDQLRRQGAPQYDDSILKADDDEAGEDDDSELDARFDEAVAIVAQTRRCSTSWLQRKMTVGYNRAAKIVEAMEKRGMVGPPNGAKDREVLLPPPAF